MFRLLLEVKLTYYILGNTKIVTSEKKCQYVNACSYIHSYIRSCVKAAVHNIGNVTFDSLLSLRSWKQSHELRCVYCLVKKRNHMKRNHVINSKLSLAKCTKQKNLCRLKITGDGHSNQSKFRSKNRYRNNCQ